MNEQPTRPPLVDASGRPARQAASADCPQCGADKKKRGPSCGFGIRRPTCYVCGYKWEDEVWHD